MFLKDFAETPAEDALRETALDEYKNLIEVLEGSLVYLNTNLAILKQLSTFRSDLFLGMTNAFLYFCWQNMYQYSVLICRRLWNDSNGIDLKTLQSFVFENIKCEYKLLLQDRLRALKPEQKNFNRIFAKILKVRNVRLAHLDAKFHIEPTEKIAGVKASELNEAAEFLGKFFNCFGFDTTHTFVLIELDSQGTNDLSYILDLLALNSDIIKFYDDDRFRRHWEQLYRPNLELSDIEEINTIRRRHGLEDIK